MRDRLLSWWGDFAYRRAGTVLVIIVLLTAGLATISPKLEMTTRWVDMMPEHDPMTVEFNNILDKYSSASNVVVVVQGEEDKIKAFAERLAPQVAELTGLVKRVQYKVETDYLSEHGFMLVKENDLKDQVDIYRDLNLIPFMTAINDNFEKEYISDDESLSGREKEDGAVRYLDGLEFWLRSLSAFAGGGAELNKSLPEEAVGRFLIGDPYYINNDKNVLVLYIHPTFPVTETFKSIDCVNRIDEIIAGTIGEFEGVEAGLTGTLTLVRDEMAAMETDTFVTTIIAFALILVLFILSFRIWTAPLLAGITLAVGLVWASIYAAVTVQTLNLMTSMFAVILVGLGIDFSIHIIALFTEMRGEGRPGREAMRETLLKAGPGVITGGITTACAFFTMTISDSRGMSEFGLVAGGGLITCMLAGIIVLPSLLALRERIFNSRSAKAAAASRIQFRLLEKAASGITRRPWPILFTGLAVTVVFVILASQLTFDYNYLNMEPKGLKSVILQDRMIEAFDISPDFVLVTSEDVEQARRFTEAAKDYKSVGMVESISEYVPSVEQQARRRIHIEEIHSQLENLPPERTIKPSDISELIDQIERLGMNIIELADMAYLGGQDRVDDRASLIVGVAEDTLSINLIDSLIQFIEENPENAAEGLNTFQKAYRPILEAGALRMADTAEITLATLPVSIFEKFADNNGENFLVTIYPEQQVWDFEFLDRFSAQMNRVSDRITGTPPLFLRMMSLIGSEGKTATVLAIVVVFILLSIDFKSVKLAFLAMIPLLIGVVWMLGLLRLCGLQFTFLNVMAVPLIVGIGIDDGVHALHRYRSEGPGSIVTVMKSTGRAILITSLTTMMAFGSLVFATYRGLGSMGILLFLGVGACFLTTFIVLTAIITLTEKKRI